MAGGAGADPIRWRAQPDPTLAVTTPPIDNGHLEALRNLSKKQQGEDVGFINIADARALTELGLAVRTPQGWQITDAGSRLLAGIG